MEVDGVRETRQLLVMFVAQYNNACYTVFWHYTPHHTILETRVVLMVKCTMLIMQHFGDMHCFGPTNTKLQDMIYEPLSSV